MSSYKIIDHEYDVVVLGAGGSGLRAVASAYQSVKLNENNIVIAGGQESMSNAPHAINFRKNKINYFIKKTSRLNYKSI